MASIGVIGSHYYVVVAADQATNSWTSAAAASEQAGGHLVTLTSAEEDSFVRDLAGPVLGDYWIGLSDAASEGDFAWVTGEPLVYTNWDEGEPNNFDGDEDYATGNFAGDSGVGYAAKWNDNDDLIDRNPIGGYVVEFESGDDFRFGGFFRGADSFTGSAGADTIRAGPGADTLDGGIGEDRLNGGAGADLFVLRAADGPGRETIVDFDLRGDDTILLEGFGLGFDEVLAGARERNGNVLIDLGGGSVLRLLDTTIATLTADDFVFA